MTQETLQPSQRAREAAHRALASRGWFPSAGDVPYDVARDLLAERLERSILSEHDSRVEKLEAALRRCRNQFEFYVSAHTAKTPPDMDKAATNQEFVEMCDAALNGGSDAE